MTTPHEPDDRSAQTPRPSSGPASSGEPATTGDSRAANGVGGGQSSSGPVENTPGGNTTTEIHKTNGSGTRPSSPPPWERGNVGSNGGLGSENGSSAGGGAAGGSGDSGNGPAPAASTRPLVTGTAAARILGGGSASASGGSSGPAPINRVDATGALHPRNGSGAETASAGTSGGAVNGRDGEHGREGEYGRATLTGRVIDSPTHNIERSKAPDNLPDLDAIHHTRPAAAAGAPAAGAGSAGVSGGVAAGAGATGSGGAAPGSSSTARPVYSSPTHAGPLRAAVQLRRIDPWSAFKISAVLSVACFCVWMIAVGILYLVLDGMGVWDSLNSSFGTLVSNSDGSTASYEISAGTVFSIAALIGIANMVLFTALSTIGAFIYNLTADLVGGVEVTLADRD